LGREPPAVGATGIDAFGLESVGAVGKMAIPRAAASVGATGIIRMVDSPL
jgi:hypothetical protein